MLKRWSVLLALGAACGMSLSPAAMSARSRPATATSGKASAKKTTAPVKPKAPSPVKPKAPSIDPAAKALLTQAIAAYGKLQRFSATLNRTYEGDEPGTSHITLAFERPNRFAVRSQRAKGSSSVVSDAGLLHAFSTESAKFYIETKVGNELLPVLGDMLDTLGPSTVLAPMFMLAGRSLLPPDRMMTSLALTGPATVGDTPVHSLTVQTGTTASDKTKLTLSFGKADALLRRYRLEMDAGKNILTDVYSDLKTDPTLPADAFVFTPPTTARVLDPKLTWDPRLKVGGEPFAFTQPALDGKPVSLADYKGKVVLLDFWATWCPPCREEMPNVVAAYKKHKADGFTVLGVSLDDQKDKETVASYMQKTGMEWRTIFDGKGRNAEVAEQYLAMGIPFSLLIGRDGKIAEINPRGELLEPALTKALAATP